LAPMRDYPRKRRGRGSPRADLDRLAAKAAFVKLKLAPMASQLEILAMSGDGAAQVGIGARGLISIKYGPPEPAL
jgi:hypothetical protein